MNHNPSVAFKKNQYFIIFSATLTIIAATGMMPGAKVAVVGGKEILIKYSIVLVLMKPMLLF